MIIGISGKSQTGKDTIGSIIQYLITKKEVGYTTPDCSIDFYGFLDNKHNKVASWQIKKFADGVKDIVCMLTGCTRSELEDNEFKSQPLSDNWLRWYIYVPNAPAFTNSKRRITTYYATKDEAVEALCKIKSTVQGAKIANSLPTYRQLLQEVGTDAIRNVIHPNAWINAVMKDYKGKLIYDEATVKTLIEPNWIITDVRFPNEAQAIRNVAGKIIKVIKNRTDNSDHESERSVLYVEADYTIVNNGTIDDLIKAVKDVLNHLKIV